MLEMVSIHSGFETETRKINVQEALTLHKRKILPLPVSQYPVGHRFDKYGNCTFEDVEAVAVAGPGVVEGRSVGDSESSCKILRCC